MQIYSTFTFKQQNEQEKIKFKETVLTGQKAWRSDCCLCVLIAHYYGHASMGCSFHNQSEDCPANIYKVTVSKLNENYVDFYAFLDI